MVFINYFLGTLLLSVAVNAQMQHFFRSEKVELECARETELTFTDILEWKNNTLDVTEKLLCFFKCKLDKLEYLDEFGMLNMTLVAPRIYSMRFLPIDQRKELVQCMSRIDHIITCEDVNKIRQCINQLSIFHHNSIIPSYWQHKMECAQETGLNMMDIIEFHHNNRQPNEKILCYVKCFYEKEDRLTEDGELKIDIVEHAIDTHGVLLSNFQKREYKKCLRTVPAIHTCEDTRQILDCYPDRRNLHMKRRQECINELGLHHNNEITDERDLELEKKNNLCYVRCMYQKNGSLDENGELDLEIMNEHVDRMHRFTRRRRAEIKECLKSVPIIKDCEYVQYILDCMQ